VRIAASMCLKELYERLGEEFLVFLPETIPSLAELMEDSDEHVQTAVQELAAVIQIYLGDEDLSSLFQH
jgi:U3 small nucleolar RNA-associated protein 10